MKINLLALDDVFDTGLSIMLDTFSTANELAEMMALTSLRFDVNVIGMRSKVRTAQGLILPTVAAKNWRMPDWIVIPAIGYKMPGPLAQALERQDVKDAVAKIAAQAAQGVKIAAACIGTFILAESGLLDGENATTTWWLAPFFRERYPQIRLDESRMLVSSGQLVTAGAALGHIDLALWIIRQSSPELATLTAKYLIIDSRPSQSAYVIVDHLMHSDPLVARFERWARSRLAQGFSLDDASQALATSKRTLARRMRVALGKTPLSYFQDLRIEHAVHLLKTSDHNIELVAAAVGYSDGVTLRSLLRRRLGRGIREIRASE